MATWQDPHPRSAGMVVKKTRKQELLDALEAHPNQDVVRLLFDNQDFKARLTVTPDGSGNVVVLGTALHMDEVGFQESKDVKSDLNAQFGEDVQFAVLTSSSNPGSPDFWLWVATLSTPLYPKVDNP